MPHRVKKAVEKLDSLRKEVKAGEALTASVVDIALAGDREALLEALLIQMKAFQVSFDPQVIEATETGTVLAKDLLHGS